MVRRVVTAFGVSPAASLVERFGLMPELTGVSPAAPLFESIRLTPDLSGVSPSAPFLTSVAYVLVRPPDGGVSIRQIILAGGT